MVPALTPGAPSKSGQCHSMEEVPDVLPYQHTEGRDWGRVDHWWSLPAKAAAGSASAFCYRLALLPILLTPVGPRDLEIHLVGYHYPNAVGVHEARYCQTLPRAPCVSRCEKCSEHGGSFDSPAYGPQVRSPRSSPRETGILDPGLSKPVVHAATT